MSPQDVAEKVVMELESRLPGALSGVLPEGPAKLVVDLVMGEVRKALAGMPGAVVDAGEVSWRRVGQVGQ